jgi:hypothetical protein
MLPEINPASDRCLRWTDRQHSWVRRSEGGFDASRFLVEPIDLRTARTYVETHHYSASYVADRFRFGLYLNEADGPALVGVAVFGIPASRRVLTNVLPDLEPYVESIELSRLVLEGGAGQRDSRAPGNSETWFLARCFTELSASGVRGVVSFADPVPRRIAGRTVFPGHYGTTYQAASAQLTGRGTPRTLSVLPDGTVLNDRSMQKVRRQEQGHDYVERRLVALGASAPAAGCRDMAGWLAGALQQVGVVRLRHRGNYRYCFAVGPDRRTRANVRIVGGGQAYPKALDA